jgi:hypothetical protein
MSINPPTPAIIPALRPLPGNSPVYTNTTPFTVRDNATMLWELENVKTWIKETLTPHVDKSYAYLIEKWTENLTAIITSVNQGLTAQANAVNSALTAQANAVNNALAEQSEEITTAITEQQAAVLAQLAEQNEAITAQLLSQDTSVDTRLADNLAAINAAVNTVINATIEVTDPIIMGVFGNVASAARQWLDARYAPATGFPVIAAMYGVSAANPDNTAALNAAFEAAKNKSVILPPGILRCGGQIVVDGANVEGAGVSTTVLEWFNQLGGTTPAFIWKNTSGQIRKLSNFEMKGPTEPQLGVKTANTWGLRLDNSVYLDQIKIQKFDAGFIFNSLSGHIYGQGLNATNCYYGMYFIRNNSDYHFLDCGFTGNRFASVATPSDVGISAVKFQRCHFGYGPIGVYQEPTPVNQGGNRIFLQEATFDNSRFEQIGNAAILTDAQDDATNFSQFADITIINPGFSWADGNAGGSPWATLPTKKASFPIVIGTSIRNITIQDGPGGFLPGKTAPTIALPDDAVGLFDIKRPNHLIWTRENANFSSANTDSQLDMRIATGTKKYTLGNYHMPIDRVLGLTLPRVSFNKTGASVAIIGRTNGKPGNNTYQAGDMTVDPVTPGLWYTAAGGVNPTDWINLLA